MSTYFFSLEKAVVNWGIWSFGHYRAWRTRSLTSKFWGGLEQTLTTSLLIDNTKWFKHLVTIVRWSNCSGGTQNHKNIDESAKCYTFNFLWNARALVGGLFKRKKTSLKRTWHWGQLY